MPMPEAAMHKDDGFVFGEYDIGFAGEFFVVQAVAESVGMEEPPHQHLGLCVFPFDAAHIVGAGLRIVDVGHAQKYWIEFVFLPLIYALSAAQIACGVEFFAGGVKCFTRAAKPQRFPSFDSIKPLISTVISATSIFPSPFTSAGAVN